MAQYQITVDSQPLHQLFRGNPRRERVIRIFPNRESAMRLIGTLFMEIEIDEKWASGIKYLDMAEHLEWRESKIANMNSKVTRIS